MYFVFSRSTPGHARQCSAPEMLSGHRDDQSNSDKSFLYDISFLRTYPGTGKYPCIIAARKRSLRRLCF